MKGASRVQRAVRSALLVLPFGGVLLLGGPLAAQDEFEVSPWYFRLDMGVSDVVDDGEFMIDSDASVLLGGAVGRTVLESDSLALAVEVHGLYLPIDVELSGVLGNAVLDWSLNEKYGLYASGGAGYVTAKVGPDEESGLGYQATAGIRYRFGRSLALNMGYHYLMSELTPEVDALVHTFEIGVTWNLYKPTLIP